MIDLTWQDWVTIMSGIIGCISLLFSFIALYKTRSGDEKVMRNKFNEIYNANHNSFVSTIDESMASIESGARKYYMVKELIKCCTRIQEFYINWEVKDKKIIDDFLEYLHTIPKTDPYSEIIRIELQNRLFVISAMLERIGKYNGI